MCIARHSDRPNRASLCNHPGLNYHPIADHNNSASGDIMNDKPPKSDARIGGMVATVVLILLFAFVGVFVWMSS